MEVGDFQKKFERRGSYEYALMFGGIDMLSGFKPFKIKKFK